MRLTEEEHNQIVSYVYGELTEAEKSEFEKRMADNPTIRAEVDGMIATREMLEVDTQNGAELGFDEPPSHLRAAILNAEVAARSDHVRDALGRDSTDETPSLWNRFRGLISGGGLVVTAAAVLFTVHTQNQEPPDALSEVALFKSGSESKGARSPEAVDRAQLDVLEASLAEPMQAETVGRAPTKNKPQREAETEAEERLNEGRHRGGSGRGVTDAKEAPKDAMRSPQPSLKKKEVAVKRLGSTSESEVAPLAAADHDDAMASDLAMDAPASAKAPAASAERNEAMPAEAYAGAAPPRKQTVKMQKGPPALSASESKFLRQRSSSKRARQKTNEQKRQRDLNEMVRARALGDENLALSSADRELAGGRYAEALRLYKALEEGDPKGSVFGMLPRVGRMKALAAMNQCNKAVTLFPLIAQKRLTMPGVPDGYLVMGECFEKTGDKAKAQFYYKKLLSVPNYGDVAKKKIAEMGER